MEKMSITWEIEQKTKKIEQEIRGLDNQYRQLDQKYRIQLYSIERIEKNQNNMLRILDAINDSITTFDQNLTQLEDFLFNTINIKELKKTLEKITK